MTEQEAYGQAFENGRKVGDAEGYARGKAEALKRGRWEYRDRPYGYTFVCSECGSPWVMSTSKHMCFKSDFCPNCGARMEDDLP